jgi:hypothetical protein
MQFVCLLCAGRAVVKWGGGVAMPIHDWTRMEAGDFHHFHHQWIATLADTLNAGGLPPGYMALAEEVRGRPIPDVVTLQTQPRPAGEPEGGVAVAESPPTSRVVARFEKVVYARRANRVAIRHGRGRVVAIIEIVSPGNKSGRNAIRSFVDKAVEIINQGVNLLVVDLFPPTPRDPHGLPRLIAEEFGDESFDLPPDKPLTVASFTGGDVPAVYGDSFGEGDAIPAAPIFLSDARYLPAPLDETYNRTWAAYPAFLKGIMAGLTAESPPPAAD